MMKRYKNRNYRLTQYQIALLEKLVNEESARLADDPSRAAADLHLLNATLQNAKSITVTKTIR